MALVGPEHVEELDAWLFDLDGVLTDTAVVHAEAWSATFDEVLRRCAGDVTFAPFTGADYDRYVDGKPRYDGVRDFLASRDVHLPEGSAADPPERDTVHGVGNRKNQLVLERLAAGRFVVFPGSVALVEALRRRGTRTAVVSASENCRAVLRSGGIASLFDVVVDGRTASERHLAGKPAPDSYLCAAAELAVPPERAAVVEDALAGVQAGRAGGFGWVVGVARHANRRALAEAGADVVVGDLGELVGEETTAQATDPGSDVGNGPEAVSRGRTALGGRPRS
jgi:beta-phosphoglucomutase family hydrolase